MALEKARLESGLRVYVDHMPEAYTNSATVFLPYGSVNEQPGEEGVAHAFEHCVHVETDDFEDRTALRRFAKLNGMDTNANTHYTRTLYYANGVGIETNLRYLGQILRHTHFPEEGVAHEMKAIRREAATKLDDTNTLHSVARTLAWAGYPYGRRVIGFHDKLDFSADKLKELHEQYYKLGRMSLVVAGSTTLEEVVALADRYFTGVTDKEDSLPTPELPDVELPDSLSSGLVREESQNARVFVSHPLAPEFMQHYTSRDRFIYGIAWGAMREACFRSLRYEQGLSYDGGIYIAAYNHPNAWCVGGYVTTDPENVGAATTTLREYLSRGSKSYETEDIMGAIAMHRYSMSASMSVPDARVEVYTGRLEAYLEPFGMDELHARTSELTVERVKDAIDEIAANVAETPEYVHLTGPSSIMGSVDRLITRDEIA